MAVKELGWKASPTCKGCWYLSKGLAPMCMYYLNTGKRRGTKREDVEAGKCREKVIRRRPSYGRSWRTKS